MILLRDHLERGEDTKVLFDGRDDPASRFPK
jgi:hypothetical protein